MATCGFNARLTHNRLIRFVLLLRRRGPVPGILAAGRTGAIVDKSERRYAAWANGFKSVLRYTIILRMTAVSATLGGLRSLSKR